METGTVTVCDDAVSEMRLPKHLRHLYRRHLPEALPDDPMATFSRGRLQPRY